MMMKPEAWIEKDPRLVIKVREAQEKSLILRAVKAQDLCGVLGGGQLAGELKKLVERVMNDMGHMFGKPETTLRMSKDYEDAPNDKFGRKFPKSP